MTQEKKINAEIMKRIMSENKITFPSLKKQDLRRVLSETVKVSDLLTNIPTNITELKDLIYPCAKLVWEKNNGDSEKHLKKFKTRMENRIRIEEKKTAI